MPLRTRPPTVLLRHITRSPQSELSDEDALSKRVKRGVFGYFGIVKDDDADKSLDKDDNSCLFGTLSE
ncbi:hypothetical protein L1987_35299 [Smallanthus sonchifolius]|uniref:Uncharacterized protein n=1 Tax=Smallanthus sonchifolius TaxID=185202 RepID=A0ACB9HX11_9ASTR|nr:hypothetical protein L1987_35299 [Smallanthus sonchifolius]